VQELLLIVVTNIHYNCYRVWAICGNAECGK